MDFGDLPSKPLRKRKPQTQSSQGEVRTKMASGFWYEEVVNQLYSGYRPRQNDNASYHRPSTALSISADYRRPNCVSSRRKYWYPPFRSGHTQIPSSAFVVG